MSGCLGELVHVPTWHTLLHYFLDLLWGSACTCSLCHCWLSWLVTVHLGKFVCPIRVTQITCKYANISIYIMPLCISIKLLEINKWNVFYLLRKSASMLVTSLLLNLYISTPHTSTVWHHSYISYLIQVAYTNASKQRSKQSETLTKLLVIAAYGGNFQAFLLEKALSTRHGSYFLIWTYNFL